MSDTDGGQSHWRWRYSYDRMDTLTERYTNITNTSGVAFNYHYNSKGLLSRIDLNTITLNGTTVTGYNLEGSERYYYDASDRLYKVEEIDGNTGTVITAMS